MILFCEKYEIDIPDMTATYKHGGRDHRQSDITNKHHFWVDIFNAAIDTQLHELHHRFSDDAIELLILAVL